MTLPYLLDENLRGVLWRTSQRHNIRGIDPLDVVRVGGPADLPLSTPDPDILLWAEREGRILISLDERTLVGHLAHHLHLGHHSPGIYILRQHSLLRQILDFLVEASYHSDPAEWQDRVEYIP